MLRDVRRVHWAIHGTKRKLEVAFVSFLLCSCLALFTEVCMEDNFTNSLTQKINRRVSV